MNLIEVLVSMAVLGKKGIEPLITTVILVGVVIASTVVVYFWGQEYVESIQEKQGSSSASRFSCTTDIRINVLGVTGNKIRVENTGNGKIDAFLLRKEISGASVPEEKVVEVAPGTIAEVPFSGPPSSMQSIEVIPKIRLGKGVYQPCIDQKITYSL